MQDHNPAHLSNNEGREFTSVKVKLKKFHFLLEQITKCLKMRPI